MLNKSNDSSSPVKKLSLEFGLTFFFGIIFLLSLNNYGSVNIFKLLNFDFLFIFNFSKLLTFDFFFLLNFWLLFCNKIIIVQRKSWEKLYNLFITLRYISIIFMNISISVSKDLYYISIIMVSILNQIEREE